MQSRSIGGRPCRRPSTRGRSRYAPPWASRRAGLALGGGQRRCGRAGRDEVDRGRAAGPALEGTSSRTACQRRLERACVGSPPNRTSAAASRPSAAASVAVHERGHLVGQAPLGRAAARVASACSATSSSISSTGRSVNCSRKRARRRRRRICIQNW